MVQATVSLRDRIRERMWMVIGVGLCLCTCFPTPCDTWVHWRDLPHNFSFGFNSFGEGKWLIRIIIVPLEYINGEWVNVSCRWREREAIHDECVQACSIMHHVPLAALTVTTCRRFGSNIASALSIYSFSFVLSTRTTLAAFAAAPASGAFF